MTEQEKFEQWYVIHCAENDVYTTEIKVREKRQGTGYGDYVALDCKWEGWQAKAQYTGNDPEMGFILEAANEGELAAYDYGCEGMMAALTEVLDDTKGREGKSHPEWQKLKERVWKLMDKAAELDNFGWQ